MSMTVPRVGRSIGVKLLTVIAASGRGTVRYGVVV